MPLVIGSEQVWGLKLLLRKKLGHWPCYQSLSPEVSSPKQHMGMVTFLYISLGLKLSEASLTVRSLKRRMLAGVISLEDEIISKIYPIYKEDEYYEILDLGK